MLNSVEKKFQPRKYVIADVFTHAYLAGNPVAIFTEASGLSADDMQKIARELNLSETTFVFPPERGGDAKVRIFTPVNELPFAGHPTLGTAVILAKLRKINHLKLETTMGVIPFDFKTKLNDEIGSAEMEQPIPSWKSYEYEKTLLTALDLQSSTLPIEIYHNGPRHVFVGLPSVAALSALQPDHRLLANLPDVAINCFAHAVNHQWRMRMFSPAYGVVEDAATGSAAGPLALHLIRHGQANFDQWIEIHQGVEMGRPSTMHACVNGSLEKIISIKVAGSAVPVAHGEFFSSLPEEKSL